MKPFQHKAKLAFLTADVEPGPSLFFQLEDGRILLVEITDGQLAGLIADGVKLLVATSALVNNRTGERSKAHCSLSASSSQHQPGADEYQAPAASAPTSPPQPCADAPLSKAEAKT